MKRTSRSASRRASRQLAANVPGLRASSPYSSNVDAGSFDRSVSAGTLACMRKAISYWAVRVVIDRLRVDRLEEAQLVGHGGGPREQVADPRPGLAALPEPVLRRGDRERLLGGGHAGQPLPAADRVRQVLAEQVLELRLVIE